MRFRRTATAGGPTRRSLLLLVVVLLAAAAAVASDLLLYHGWTGTAVPLGDVGVVFSDGDGGGAGWWYWAVVVEAVELVVLGAVDMVDDGDEDDEDGGEDEGVRVERVMLVMVIGCVGRGGGEEKGALAGREREREDCLSLRCSRDRDEREVLRERVWCGLLYISLSLFTGLWCVFLSLVGLRVRDREKHMAQNTHRTCILILQ